MAVTINQNPQLITPSDNPVVFTFSSDQTAQTNFSFLVDIFINGSIIKTQQIFPESGINARIDISAWTSNACNAPVLTAGFVTDALNQCTYQVQVWERYGATPIKQAQSTSTLRYAFKGGLAPDDFIDYVGDDYRFTAAIGRDFFTNFNGGYESGTKSTGEYPKLKRTGEEFRIMVMNYFQNLSNFNIELFDANDVSVVSWTGSPTANGNLFSVIDLSPAQLIASTTITQTNIDASAYMKIKVTIVTRTFRINFNDDYTYPRYKRIHFLSQLGSMEAFTFGLISRESAAIKSNSYKRIFGEWNGDQFEYNKTRAVDISYAKTVDPKISIESDWIKETVQNWLVKNLYTSVYIFEENDSLLVGRKITSTGYEYKYQDNDMLFLEKITLLQHSYTTMVL